MRTRVLPALLLSAALVLLPVVAASATTHARTVGDPAVTWGVVPANPSGPDTRYSFAYAVDPGRLIQDDVAILNTGTKEATFKLYAADAITDFETGAFGLQPASKKPIGLATWIHLSADSVTVQPGQAAIVPFQVSVPTNAPPGDHAAGIIASITTKSTGANGAGINLEQRVGAAVYTRVSGDATASVKVSGLVASFSSQWNPFAPGKASVDYQVKNAGNVRMDITQDLTVQGPFGISLAHVTNIKPVLNLLPGESTHSHIDVEGIPALLLLFANVTLTPGPPTDSLAKSAEKNYDGTPAAPRAPLTYTPASGGTLTGAVPWLLLLIIALLSAAIVLVVRYFRTSQLRMWEAIDLAADEAREAALEEARESSRAQTLERTGVGRGGDQDS